MAEHEEQSLPAAAGGREKAAAVRDGIKKIAILGGGHGGFAAAADLSHRGFTVRLQARRAAALEPVRQAGGIFARGLIEALVPIEMTTTDIAEAVGGADLIMLVVPSTAHAYYAGELAPLLDGSQPVFLNPGHTGGGMHFSHAVRQAGYYGPLQTCEAVSLTYATRMEGPATVGIYSRTSKLKFGAFPGKHTDALYALLHPLFPDLVKTGSVIETGLANMNAVFHPPGMIMNAGWIERTGGDFLFYKQGITSAIGRVTLGVDAERMAIAAALGVPHVSFLQAFYDFGLTTRAAFDSGDIARACHESDPNATIKAPASLRHRYIEEDVGFGLVALAAFARIAGVPTPTINALIQLAGLALGTDFSTSGLTLEKLGITAKTAKELLQFAYDGP